MGIVGQVLSGPGQNVFHINQEDVDIGGRLEMRYLKN